MRNLITWQRPSTMHTSVIRRINERSLIGCRAVREVVVPKRIFWRLLQLERVDTWLLQRGVNASYTSMTISAAKFFLNTLGHILWRLTWDASVKTKKWVSTSPSCPMDWRWQRYSAWSLRTPPAVCQFGHNPHHPQRIWSEDCWPYTLLNFF